jgi:hypothetical protein
LELTRLRFGIPVRGAQILVLATTIAAAVSQMMKPHPSRGWSHHPTHDHIIDVNGDDATLDAQFVPTLHQK